jgi:hypothetical protein
MNDVPKWQGSGLRPNNGISNRICGNPECGHPRAEHRSRFLSDINDYEYQECSVFECPCQAYVGDTGAEPVSTQSEIMPDTQQSCRACGADLLGHTFLGADCLAICESNWKKLRALQPGTAVSQDDTAARLR